MKWNDDDDNNNTQTPTLSSLLILLHMSIPHPSQCHSTLYNHQSAHRPLYLPFLSYSGLADGSPATADVSPSAIKSKVCTHRQDCCACCRQNDSTLCTPSDKSRQSTGPQTELNSSPDVLQCKERLANAYAIPNSSHKFWVSFRQPPVISVVGWTPVPSIALSPLYVLR